MQNQNIFLLLNYYRVIYGTFICSLQGYGHHGWDFAVTVWCQVCTIHLFFHNCGLQVAFGKVGWYGRDNMVPSYYNITKDLASCQLYLKFIKILYNKIVRDIINSMWSKL